MLIHRSGGLIAICLTAYERISAAVLPYEEENGGSLGTAGFTPAKPSDFQDIEIHLGSFNSDFHRRYVCLRFLFSLSMLVACLAQYAPGQPHHTCTIVATITTVVTSPRCVSL